MPLCMQKPNIEMTERILAFDLDFQLYSRDIEKSFKNMLVDSGCIFMKDPKLAFAWLKTWRASFTGQLNEATHCKFHRYRLSCQ